MDYLRVSEQVIVAVLRRRVEDQLTGVAVKSVAFRVSREQGLEQVSVDLIGQYGRSLAHTAAEVRGVVDTELRALISGHQAAIRVATTHLHFGDITVGDPTLQDPRD